MTKERAQIRTGDIPLQDPISTLLEPGITGDDLAIVTDDTMQSQAIAEYTKELAFMEEMVTFSISTSENPHAINPVECGVQGIQRKFYRGQQYTVERKFINALINVCFNVETVNRKDPVTGLDVTEVKRTPYEAFPISIHNDPSPYGAKWLEYKRNGDQHVKRR